MLVVLASLAVASCQMLQPILMKWIMDYISNGEKTNEQNGLYFCSVFLIRVVLAIILPHFYYKICTLGFNLTNTLSLMIYNKATKHPLLTEKNYSVSDIINYSQVDAQRMTYIGFQISSVLFAPIQIVIGLVLLYLNIGISFLVGLGVMAVMILLTLIFTHVATKINDAIL